MNLSVRMWISILAAALSLPAARAGQQAPAGSQRVEPASPVSSGEARLGGQASEETTSGATTLGAPALSGATEFTPGKRQSLRSYIFPSFQFSEAADSNFSITSGPQRFETINTLVGRLAFKQAKRRSQVTADYVGGGTIYNHHSELNNTMHQFGITQTYQGRRWGWTLDDRATYLPESAFGFGLFGWQGSLGLDIGGAFGSNLASLSPMYNANQSIYNGRGSRVANTFVAQVQYMPSRRSTFSLTGSYGLLHFRTPGSFDSRNTLTVAGYSRSLSSRDTLGVTYALNMFRFRNIGRSFNTHIAELDYGHRVTGRLAVQAGGGAQVNVFSSAVAGSTTSPSWIAHGSINYAAPRNAFELSYGRYTTNGGGVVVGASTQLVQFSWSRQLSRHWSGSLGSGYSHNRSLPQTASSKAQFTFDSFYGSASLSRSLGRHTTMFLTYYEQNQTSEAAPCLVGNCRPSLLRHLVAVGFDWHARQITAD